ncbi:hypothetical protein EJ377_02975 [Chryseobacterium arthrosphaerae]|uniref:Condensation domain-containing protein n=1 Tax=Chryseobacterium arthrosphaerae TaxID=651561 RepID=A0A3S0QVP1_9FLAO|nr:hypothetical protein EJ377_02975 [Chryseobacterium arthrosphaerae]
MENLFEEEKTPLARVVWVRGQEVSEVFWAIPHCISDGTTGVTLMKELLQLLDDPSLELEPYEPFSSVDEFLPSNFNVKSKKFKARLYLAFARFFFMLQQKAKEKPWERLCSSPKAG